MSCSRSSPFCRATPGSWSWPLVLALAAALLPDARRRGLRGIGALGVGQAGLILLLAPTLPFLPVVLGTGLLCAALAALSLQSGRYP